MNQGAFSGYFFSPSWRFNGDSVTMEIQSHLPLYLALPPPALLSPSSAFSLNLSRLQSPLSNTAPLTDPLSSVFSPPQSLHRNTTLTSQSSLTQAIKRPHTYQLTTSFAFDWSILLPNLINRKCRRQIGSNQIPDEGYQSHKRRFLKRACLLTRLFPVCTRDHPGTVCFSELHYLSSRAKIPILGFHLLPGNYLIRRDHALGTMLSRLPLIWTRNNTILPIRDEPIIDKRIIGHTKLDKKQHLAISNMDCASKQERTSVSATSTISTRFQETNGTSYLTNYNSPLPSILGPWPGVQKNNVARSQLSNLHYPLLVKCRDNNVRIPMAIDVGNTTQEQLKPSNLVNFSPCLEGRMNVLPHFTSCSCSQSQTASILGPHPSYCCNYLTKPPLQQPLKFLSNMNLTDEEFITKFTSMHSSVSSTHKLISLPKQTEATRDWSLCLLVRVISERHVIDANFARQMMRVWRLEQGFTISPVSRNVYLVEFSCKQDLATVLDGGPWTYRMDLVAVKQVTAHQDIMADHINHVDLWVQLHNAFPDTLNLQGMEMLVKAVGDPVTTSSIVSSGGRRYIRAKIKINLLEPIKDKVNVLHPSLGHIIVYLVYERLNRACSFCGIIGHDYSSCKLWARLFRLSRDPRYKDRPELQTVSPIRLGPWISCSSQLPISRTCSIPLRAWAGPQPPHDI